MNRLKRRRYQLLLLVALVLTVLIFMYVLRTVFNPLLLALALAYILNPVVNWLERRRVPRKSAVVCLLSLLGAFTLATVIMVIPVAMEQASGWYVGLLGEPFPGDHNRNGRYDPQSEKDSWDDANGNGRYDGPESYTDRNGNGRWDDERAGEPFQDTDGNGLYDSGESYTDQNGNGRYDPAVAAEAFVDSDGDGQFNAAGEPFKDYNENGRFDANIPADEPWEDLNHNGVYDKGYLGKLADRLTRADSGEKPEGLAAVIHRVAPRHRWAPLVKSAVHGVKQNVRSVVTNAHDVISTAFSKSWAAAGWLMDLGLMIVLTPIYMAFLLYGMRGGWEGFVRHIPATIRPRFLEIVRKIDIVIGAFFRGRLLVCAAIGLFTAIGYAICGVKFGVLLGLATGALSLIPFLNVVPFALTLLVAWLEGMGFGGLALVVLVYVLGQWLDPLLMTLVMGKELQLHPITILLSMFVCASLLGFFGMLLAVPLVAVGKILFQEFILPHLRELAEDPAL